MTRLSALTAGAILISGLTMAKIATGEDPVTIQVAKTPSCGCCSAWIEHLQDNGFEVAAYDMTHAALDALKRDLDIDPGLVSCHTATVSGYFIEGHVPAEDIARLLETQPENARGLSVPGMPIGSPGMEMGDQRDPFTTLLVQDDNQTQVFNTHNQ